MDMASSPYIPSLEAPQKLRWLYVDFNSYFASVEQQLDPRLRGRPVAVIPVETNSTCAIAASYEAKAFGIRTGTPIYEARQKCPELICVLARHERYVEFHHNILEEIDRHIPVTQTCSIDEMACRLMENETSPERAKEIAMAVKRGLASNIGEHVRCSVGIAPNKYLAKVATDLQKPDGLTILRKDDIPHRLLSLNLRSLPGIGHNMEHRLLRSGISDMATLLKLQPKHMRAVWGSLWGEKMWYMLRGFDIPDQETERSSLGHSHVLPPESRPPEQAFQIARRLTVKAAARLRRIGYYAGSVSLSVRIENGPRLALEKHCLPAQDSMTFLRIVQDLWQILMKEGQGRRLKKVSVTFHSLTPVGTLQPDLFDSIAQDNKTSVKNKNISLALDNLNHKFGRDTVSIGMTPAAGKSFSGTKIAFTRIPDMAEFLE